jgi:hypothetical protein
MAIKRQLPCILAAVIVMIALALAPSVAFAHAGHHSGAGPVAHHDSQPAQATEQGAPKAATQYLLSVPASHSPSTDNTGCHRGSCCAGGPCTACCAVAVPDLVVSMPPAMSSALMVPNSSTSDSLDPDGLRRPPRFFA